MAFDPSPLLLLSSSSFSENHATIFFPEKGLFKGLFKGPISATYIFELKMPPPLPFGTFPKILPFWKCHRPKGKTILTRWQLFLAGEAGHGWVHFDLWASLHHQPGERLQKVNLANLKMDISLEKLSKICSRLSACL